MKLKKFSLLCISYSKVQAQIFVIKKSFKNEEKMHDYVRFLLQIRNTKLEKCEVSSWTPPPDTNNTCMSYFREIHKLGTTPMGFSRICLRSRVGNNLWLCFFIVNHANHINQMNQISHINEGKKKYIRSLV